MEPVYRSLEIACATGLKAVGNKLTLVGVENLRAGESAAVYPEATISRSFELNEFKSGAARMAREETGAHWIPAGLGGSAPTPERAAELDAVGRGFA